MDLVEEIKARLPIEELVGQYRQIKKKGRNFVCLCPFHNDTHPSMVVSPDKGIAYCFACNNGGDIFSFYQTVEGVDFRQALKDLAERTGVELPKDQEMSPEKKDEKDRLRSCLEAVLKLYQTKLSKHDKAKEYLKKRNVSAEQIKTFQVGVAPDSFSTTYEHLLKDGFSRSEILAAGLGVQKELKEEKIYDRFRNRLMFPIHDLQGRIVGFGGRTLGEDDAKYINSSEGPLYQKSRVLYGFHHAKDAMRESKTVILVEGYFDVLACHRVGVHNVVAVSGTALTEDHVRVIKRTCEKVVLCLDQDTAGRDAAERAFHLCSSAELRVHIITLEHKDPADAADADPKVLRGTLESGGDDYIEHVLLQIGEGDIASADGKHIALQRALPLIAAVPSAVQREHYLASLARVLRTTETVLQQDMEQFESQQRSVPIPSHQNEATVRNGEQFSRIEMALGLFYIYPKQREIISQLIEPTDGFASAFYGALKSVPEAEELTPDMLDLPAEHRERVAVLQLFCEENGLGNWPETMATSELKKHCRVANQTMLRSKLRLLSTQLLDARRDGKKLEEEQLRTQYQQVLKIAKIATA